eukprot:760645-Hanusia_phi.AAC.1
MLSSLLESRAEKLQQQLRKQAQLACDAHSGEDEQVEGKDEGQGEEGPGSKDDDKCKLCYDSKSPGEKLEDRVGDEVINVGQVLDESIEDHPDWHLVEQFL